jgi:hypothetical protein
MAYRFGFSGGVVIENQPLNAVNFPLGNYNPFNKDLTSKSRSFALGINAGYQCRIANFKKLETYTGADLGLATDYNYSVSKSIRLDSSYSENSTKSRMNVRVNVIPFIGFNYYLGDRLAIGAEYRISVASLLWNRGIKEESIIIEKNGNVSLTSVNTIENGFRFDGRLNGSAVITATLFLHKQK